MRSVPWHPSSQPTPSNGGKQKHPCGDEKTGEHTKTTCFLTVLGQVNAHDQRNQRPHHSSYFRKIIPVWTRWAGAKELTYAALVGGFRDIRQHREGQADGNGPQHALEERLTQAFANDVNHEYGSQNDHKTGR